MTDKLDFEMTSTSRSLVIKANEWKKYTGSDSMGPGVFLAHKLKDACQAIDKLKGEIEMIKNNDRNQEELKTGNDKLYFELEVKDDVSFLVPDEKHYQKYPKNMRQTEFLIRKLQEACKTIDQLCDEIEILKEKIK